MSKVQSAVMAVAFLAALAAASPAQAADAAQANPVVNINTATAAELTLLPGVGEATAKAILDLRSKAPFKKADDIMRVKGIGKKTFKKMSGYLTLQGPTTATAKLRPQT